MQIGQPGQPPGLWPCAPLQLLVRLVPVVIRKLGLGDAAVSQRVMAILSHVNKVMGSLLVVGARCHGRLAHTPR